MELRLKLRPGIGLGNWHCPPVTSRGSKCYLHFTGTVVLIDYSTVLYCIAMVILYPYARGIAGMNYRYRYGYSKTVLLPVPVWIQYCTILLPKRRFVLS